MPRRIGLSCVMLCVVGLSLPTVVQADTLITPFAGLTFGGDAKVHRPAFGAGVTFVGRSLGLEVELARVNRFFGDDPTSADVTTLTASVVGGADIHGRGFKPYFLTGAGLLRTGVQLGALLNDTSYNNFAILIGGGANVLVNDHLGFRADLRYFRRLERQSDLGIIPIASNFDFFRFTIGLNLHF
jgi:opacity protein-like surface antigen